MNKIVKALIIVWVCSACSSVKLLDSWKSQSFKSFAGQKILVAAKSPDLEVRKSYEIAIVNQLRKQGIKAIEIHKTFPSFEEKENPTDEEVSKIVKQFKEKGITAILITSLKSTIKTKSDNAPQLVDIPNQYQNKYLFSFNNSDDVHALPKLSALGTNDTPRVELTSTTYVLEAITYDLTQEKDKQLVNVCLVDVTDPDSGKKILERFSKIVSDQFK